MSHSVPDRTGVTTAADIGRLLREHRTRKRLSLERVCAIANVSMRFLSEVERGKPTAEIGKVLTVLRTLGLEVDIRPRGPLPPHRLAETKDQARETSGPFTKINDLIGVTDDGLEGLAENHRDKFLELLASKVRRS